MAQGQRTGEWRVALGPIVIGIGTGGFIDGIVLHQILQWHHLISNLVPPNSVATLQFNYFIDGLFHQAMLLVTLVGVLLLYTRLADPRPAARSGLVSGILLGVGFFNVVDSIVFHWVLNLHNIRPGPDVQLYDVAFFALGVVLVAAGWSRLRRA